MKKELRNLIASGHTDQAIQQLKLLSVQTGYEQWQEEILLQASRYERYSQEKRLGTSDIESQERVLNQINQALLLLIKQLPEEGAISTGPSSTANRNNSWWQWVVGAGVIIGILAGLSSITGLNLMSFLGTDPTTTSYQLTVYVHGPGGKQDIVLENEGELIFDLGNDRRIAQIGQNGRTNFGEIGAQFLGKELPINVIAEGFLLAKPELTFQYDGSPLYLEVKRDNSLGLIEGIVKTRDGQQFIEGVEILINTDTSIYTDARGIFKTILPSHMQVESVNGQYELTIRKEGFSTTTQYYYPKTKAEVRLEKQ